MKRPLVQCRLCGVKDIDRDNSIEGIDWVMRSKNWFYHKSCYDIWYQHMQAGINTNMEEEFWFDATYEYLKHIPNANIDYRRMKSQWDKYLIIEGDERKTPKGIFFSIKYFYEIEKGDIEKAKGGIGIVPYVYKRSSEYWTQIEMKHRGTVKAIELQMEQLLNRPTCSIKRTKKIKSPKTWDLTAIEA